ncbi:hypothetical protein VPH35_096649 [Triticum aestivum]
MPTHKFSRREGLLHVRMRQINHPVTMDVLRQLFHRSGSGELLCAFERTVDGEYCVEAYVLFRSRWMADRARAALDGHGVYEGCCFLTIHLLPPTYTAITMPDDDGMAPEYFYDDTPYAEWAAALAAAECHGEVDTATLLMADVRRTDSASVESSPPQLRAFPTPGHDAAFASKLPVVA